jgi:hypothetical protein
LFDSSFYLENNPDVARDGVNPLVHFARHGGFEGRDPHPLFDCSYYLETYRDVAQASINPLLHYIRNGYRQGYCPNPMFDSAYYLRSNPDVRENPLVHFIRVGAAEGRSPHPTFDLHLYLGHYPEIKESGVNPLVHYLGLQKSFKATTAVSAAAPLRENPRSGCFTVEALSSPGEPGPFLLARTVLCVGHISPYPPRAGNEYAEYRQLDYLERHGYRIVLLVSPLPGEELPPEQVRTLCDRFPYVVLCSRDGLLQHCWPDGQAVLNSLDGEALSPLAPEIGEDLETNPQERLVIGNECVYCNDYLARLALHLQTALAPCIVLSQYIFQTRFLPLIRSASLKVIQTHDMFSTKARKVTPFGVSDPLGVTPEQERRRLLRTDVILAIQSAEAREFAELVPERKVFETPTDFDVVDQPPPPRGASIFYVASDNPLNTKGLRDFLGLAWPRILREVPDAELLVAGRVCNAVPQPAENVRLLGLVNSLDPWYEQARLTINPSVAGTGLKIKIAESLSRMRAVVTWPSGVDGLQADLAALCRVARSWPEFASLVVEILRSPTEDWFSKTQKSQIRHALSPDTVYGPLLSHLDAFCEQHNLPYYRPTPVTVEGPAE